jgi:glycine betaine catabolism B
MMDAVKAALVELGVAKPRSRRKVVFQASDTTAAVPVDATILDAADEAGVFIDNACRSGTCGSCRVRLISGNVSMDVEDALTEQDKAEGYILTCQAKIRGDVKVDA